MNPKSIMIFTLTVLVLAEFTGCTPGMLGDMGDAQVQTFKKTMPRVDPSTVQIVDLVPEGGLMAPNDFSTWEKKNLPQNEVDIATINSSGSGYGDDRAKALEKGVKKAAKLGANLVVISGEQVAGGGLGNSMGDRIDVLNIDAYYIPAGSPMPTEAKPTNLK